MSGFQVSIGGAAVVCCVHDREKRQVTTEAQVVELGRQVGQVYDPKQHRLWKCSCCENLFVDPSDEPRYCRRCERPNRHPLVALYQPRTGDQSDGEDDLCVREPGLLSWCGWGTGALFRWHN